VNYVKCDLFVVNDELKCLGCVCSLQQFAKNFPMLKSTDEKEALKNTYISFKEQLGVSIRVIISYSYIY